MCLPYDKTLRISWFTFYKVFSHSYGGVATIETREETVKIDGDMCLGADIDCIRSPRDTFQSNKILRKGGMRH